MAAVFAKLALALFIVLVALFFALGLLPKVKAQEPPIKGDCVRFVRDVTIPDGTIVSPLEEIDIPTTMPGEQVDVSARMNVPFGEGEYTAVYEVALPPTRDSRTVVRVGQEFWVTVVVVKPAAEE